MKLDTRKGCPFCHFIQCPEATIMHSFARSNQELFIACSMDEYVLTTAEWTLQESFRDFNEYSID